MQSQQREEQVTPHTVRNTDTGAPQGGKRPEAPTQTVPSTGAGSTASKPSTSNTGTPVVLDGAIRLAQSLGLSLLCTGARGPLHPAQGTQTAAPVPDTPVRGQAPGTTPGGTASGNPLKGAREAETSAAAPPQVLQRDTVLLQVAHNKSLPWP